MEKLKYSNQNCEFMIKHEKMMQDAHNKLFRRYQKYFLEIGLELTLTFFWMKQIRLGLFNNESKNYHTRPIIEPGNYEFFAHYEVQKDGKTVYIVCPEGKELGDDMFDTLYISRIKKSFFSYFILLYDDIDTVSKMLDEYLCKLKNCMYDNKEYID